MTAPAIQLDYALPGTRRRRRRRIGVAVTTLVLFAALAAGYWACWRSLKREWVDFVWWGPAHNTFVEWKVEHPLLHSRLAKVIFTPAHWIDMRQRPDLWPPPVPGTTHHFSAE